MERIEEVWQRSGSYLKAFGVELSRTAEGTIWGSITVMKSVR
jgi:hypothetical protein